MRATRRAAATAAAAVLVALTLANGTATALAAGSPIAGTSPAYQQFSEFCARHFSADPDEEMLRALGPDLRTLPGGTWRHVSESSACVAWETNLPARSYVEYGPTPEYGNRTEEGERPFFLHVHYLRDLKPDTLYHYRLVAATGKGARTATEDATLATRATPNAVRLPGRLAGPPYLLDQPNATYLLTDDVVARSSAMNIAADGVTLDLGGHTVVYDEVAGSADPGADEGLFGWHSTRNPCGIRTADGKSGIRILNGTVIQGKGRGTSRPAGYNPVFLRRPRDIVVAGLTVAYSGSQVTGLFVNNAYDGVRVHHNVIRDEGTELYNRHQGVDGVMFNVGQTQEPATCHHNLIKRTRHRGITVSSNNELHSNEIYVDSYATNSYGIMYYSQRGAQGLSLHGNRIFGAGFHPVGIGSGQGWSNVQISGNYIQMQGTEKEWRWRGGEGGGDASAVSAEGIYPVNAIRFQRPGGDIQHSGNVMVVKGRGEDCFMRGLWLVAGEQGAHGLLFRDNLIKVIAEDDLADGYALSCGGAGQESRATTVALTGNTVLSNICHVQFGDNYSHGGRYVFSSNRFVRVGQDPRYRTLRLGWRGWRYDTYGHVFIDTEFDGGAGYDSVSFDGGSAGRYDFSVAWPLQIQTRAGAVVSISDATGAEVFAGRAPEAGRVVVPLTQYVRTRNGKSVLTPHKVSVTVGGQMNTWAVTMDAARSIEMVP